MTTITTAPWRRALVAVVVAAALLALLALGLGPKAEAEPKARGAQYAAGIIVAADGSLAVSASNVGAGPVGYVLRVTAASGELLLEREGMLRAGATVMPNLISARDLPQEASNEWPIYGRPINVSLTYDDAGGGVPILAVSTLDPEGGPKPQPIYNSLLLAKGKL